MAYAEDVLAQKFVCDRCRQQGAHVERLSMSGTGFSRLFELQPYQYAFASCTNCGYTEVYNLHILEGRDDLGTFLDVLFGG